MRPASAASSLRRPGRSAGGGGASALRLPTSRRAGDAELSEALGEAAVLRQHQVEGREQRPAQARPPPPALEGRRRHAAVDQDEGNVRAPWSRARGSARSPTRPAPRGRGANGSRSAARRPGCRAAHIDASAPRGRRVRASRAEVTVAVVSSMRTSGRSAAMVSITGSAALASPTLAAWNQARKPAAAARLTGRSARGAGRALLCRAACARRGSAARTAPPGW